MPTAATNDTCGQRLQSPSECGRTPVGTPGTRVDRLALGCPPALGEAFVDPGILAEQRTLQLDELFDVVRAGALNHDHWPDGNDRRPDDQFGRLA